MPSVVVFRLWQRRFTLSLEAHRAGVFLAKAHRLNMPPSLRHQHKFTSTQLVGLQIHRPHTSIVKAAVRVKSTCSLSFRYMQPNRDEKIVLRSAAPVPCTGAAPLHPSPHDFNPSHHLIFPRPRARISYPISFAPCPDTSLKTPSACPKSVCPTSVGPSNRS
jgi:hypothetical protein